MISLGIPAILLLIIVAYAFLTRYVMIKVIVGAGLLVPGLIAIIYGFTMFNSIDYSLVPTLYLIASGIVLVTVGGMLLLSSARARRVLSGAQQIEDNPFDDTIHAEMRKPDHKVESAERTADKGASKPIKPAETVCEECGTVNSIRNTYCTHCGERLPNFALLNRKRKK